MTKPDPISFFSSFSISRCAMTLLPCEKMSKLTGIKAKFKQLLIKSQKHLEKRTVIFGTKSVPHIFQHEGREKTKVLEFFFIFLRKLKLMKTQSYFFISSNYIKEQQ